MRLTPLFIHHVDDEELGFSPCPLVARAFLGSFGAALFFSQTNATAIGAKATVDASNKIVLGNPEVNVIEGAVAFTHTSDANAKENFLPVDSEEILRKIGGLRLSSWNYKGHDPVRFRHYGPMAQDFFAAFGADDLGTIGTETTINSGDISGVMLAAIQALEKCAADLEEQIAKTAELEQA